MHLIITDAWLARSRAIHLSGTKLVLAGLGLSFALMLVAAGLYHWVFLKGAREGWPIIGSLVRLVVKDEFALRDRVMRENLDMMARRIGEMQAKMLQLESLEERVSTLAGINPADIKVKPGQGGALVSGHPLSMDELQAAMDDLDHVSSQRTDLLSVVESRLFEQKVKAMMIPTQHPVDGATMGSGFGWRIDPFTGHTALHTGIDYQSPVGTTIVAAAGGVVVTQEFRPDYGNMIEIDHGKDLITRYAHTSKVYVKKGDLVRRGQKIAEIGTTGRSTGPHLHFEVLVSGVPQDPAKFMSAGNASGGAMAAHGPSPTVPTTQPGAAQVASAPAQAARPAVPVPPAPKPAQAPPPAPAPVVARAAPVASQAAPAGTTGAPPARPTPAQGAATTAGPPAAGPTTQR